MKTCLYRGYTLFEMFMTISIIFLLITIIMPVVMKSREWGQSIACKGNIKTLMSGVLAYTSDWQGRFPQDESGNGGWIIKKMWFGKLVSQSSFYLYNFGTEPECTGSYLPSAKLAPATNTNPYQVCIWSNKASAWTCPKTKLEPVNRLLQRITGVSDSVAVAYQRWTYGHYAIYSSLSMANGSSYYFHGGTLSGWTSESAIYNKKLGLSGRAFIGEAASGAGTRDTGSAIPIWPIHFGTPLNYSVNSAYYLQDSGYVYHGGGQGNWGMLDGHVDSFTWSRYYSERARSSGGYYYMLYP